MAHYWQLYLHLVWGTKRRSHILRGAPEIAAHDAIRRAVRQMDIVPVCVNSAWNHTHTLLSWNLDCSVHEVVETLKQESVDRWNQARNKSDQAIPRLAWQNGFAAFTVSPGQVESVKKYIAHQKDLHRNHATIPHYERWCTLK